MKVVMILAVICLCLAPLWAEEAKDPFDKPITLSLATGNRGSEFEYKNQIFNMKVWFWEYARQIDMDWALFSPGEECLDDNWWLGISAQYYEPPNDNRLRLVGQESKSPGMFFNFHHRTDSLELRIFYPIAACIDGRWFYPWIQLDRLKLIDFSKSTRLYLYGEYGLHHDTAISAGLRQKIGSVEIKVRSDGVWSVGANTTF